LCRSLDSITLALTAVDHPQRDRGSGSSLLSLGEQRLREQSSSRAAGVNLFRFGGGQITSIDVIVNPSADTNLQLDGLFIHDNTPLPPPPPFVTTVPEPGSLALVAIGGAVLGAWRLRRRSKGLQSF
jgi:hypothetical protein